MEGLQAGAVCPAPAEGTPEAQAEAAYVTGSGSYRAVAEKLGLPAGTVAAWGRAGGWVAKRQARQGQVCPAGRLEALLQGTGRMCRDVARILQDEEQFYLHLVEGKEKTKTPTGEREVRTLTAVRLDKPDLKAMRDMVELLKDLTALARDLYELPDQPQRHRQKMEEAKLNLSSASDQMEIRLAGEAEELAR